MKSEFENVVQNVNLLDDEIVVDNGVTLLVLEVNYKKYTYIENFPFRKSNLKKHDNELIIMDNRYCSDVGWYQMMIQIHLSICLGHDYSNILKKLQKKFEYCDDKGSIFYTIHGLVYKQFVQYFEEGWKAGMSTTQCNENMNVFFDGYTYSKTSLKQFVEQYERALMNKVEKEIQAYFKSFSQMVLHIMRYEMEKQFQTVYTISKFREVQEEFTRKLYCDLIYSSKRSLETAYET
ncbi:uncharacterized protein LOC111394215 [Olea europaea var. sylvestris]|uniref:uncharacterized protein LOC111394215 n=1 Tax=Olea europaea var. sylvestris TaxID=158386 RepID=UPI000C1D3659|nr:uncharacterized protein LOC111394215 [Olea europaea var. sylvestris]